MVTRECVARRARVLALVAVITAAVAGPLSSPADAADALLYRIFLHDGSTLVSYGDFARVADRVVFSIPIGAIDTPSPVLHLVSIAETAVDWDRTDRYAEAIRAQHYAQTRGEADFDALSTDVARALTEVARTKDPARRLALATDARRALAAWPAAHYGYRSSDVAQLSYLMDEAISDLRVAAGQSRFDLDLVATAMPLPPNVPTLPPPTLRESIEQALSAAAVTPDSTERVSLLQTLVANLEQIEQPATPALAWTSSLRAKASSALTTELKTDKSYGDLVAQIIAVADEKAKRADVGAIEGLVKATLKADDKLGRRRPQVTAALLATLDARLDAARRLRLAHDAWVLRQRAVKEYEGRIRSAVNRFRRSTTSLQQIKQLAGPSPDALPSLAERITNGWSDLKLVKPPTEAEAAHSMLIAAFQMAVRAAVSRRSAIKGTDMSTAWEASSAAAGALMLFERARDELRKLTVPPAL
jgi:hypothetical protein